MEEISTELPNSTPRIVRLSSSSSEQYFIIAEKDVFCEVPDLENAIFTWFILHYIFNIKYEKRINNVGLFFQDNIFQMSDHSSRSATYNSIIGDIKQYLKH